jgi:hypothetical protein
MLRLLQIVFFIGLILGPSGCSLSQKSKPVWEQVKIGDLAPSHRAEKLDEQILKTMNFNVYVFEMPADSISALDNVWQLLQGADSAKGRKAGSVYSGRLRFDDYGAFGANSFVAACGQIQTQSNIIDLLHTAGGRSAGTVSLLLSDGQAQTIDITGLDNEQTVFYTSAKGATEGATIGPGMLVLQITAVNIPGSKYMCDVTAQPAFLPPLVSPIMQLAEHARNREFFFTCCRIRLRMSPGDFILLGPQKYTDQQTTLGGLFFSRPESKPIIRMFLLLCTSIND